jgi:formyl-CoA transferase
VVDTAIYEAVFSMMESLIPDYELAGYVRKRMGNVLPGVAPSNIYATKDQTFVVIGANADTVFRRLCQAMNQPELAEDAKYSTHHARGENMTELDERIESWTKTMEAKECLQILEKHGVPSDLIYSVNEILEDPHYEAREMLVPVEHPVLGEFRMPGIVPKLSRTPGKIKQPGAEVMGKHNDEIYGELLEYSSDQINCWKENKVI